MSRQPPTTNGGADKLFRVVAAIMLLAGAGIIGFIVYRQNDTVTRLSLMEGRVAVLESQRETGNDALTRLESRFIAVETKLDLRLQRIEDRLDVLRNEQVKAENRGKP